MKSATLGSSTSGAEVTHISKHGLWILLGDEELFLAYEDFPWFKEAPIAKALKIERPSENHLYWPELDIDLAVASIRRPQDFPLIANS